MNDRHAEYRFQAQGSDTVIVFVHGIQGSPRQFDFLIEALDGTYSIENLLLPGHGATAGEFARSGMAQWQDYLDARVDALQNMYDKIILVGHSLGCLLAVQAALSRPRRIRGLFLLAVPLAIRFTWPYVRNNLATAFSKQDKSEIVTAARAAHSVSASTPLAYVAAAPRYIELFAKIRSTRALLPKLRLPMVVVHSAHDEIVSRGALRYVEKRPNIQVVVNGNSGHYHYPEEDREQIAKTLKNFLAGILTDC